MGEGGGVDNTTKAVWPSTDASLDCLKPSACKSAQVCEHFCVELKGSIYIRSFSLYKQFWIRNRS